MATTGAYNGGRSNATAANAIHVKDEGIGHVNSTQASGSSDAFDLLFCGSHCAPPSSPFAVVNATLTHDFCTTTRNRTHDISISINKKTKFLCFWDDIAAVWKLVIELYKESMAHQLKIARRDISRARAVQVANKALHAAQQGAMEEAMHDGHTVSSTVFLM